MENENNILNNLPPFYNNEKVISLVNHSWNGITTLIKNNEYTVENCFKCKCGVWMVKIRGANYDVDSQCYGKEYNGCGAILKDTCFLHLLFTSKKQKSFPLMTFEKIKKQEKKEILILN